MGKGAYPVERGATGNDLKPLCCKPLRGWQQCASAKKLTCKQGGWPVFYPPRYALRMVSLSNSAVPVPSVTIRPVSST